MTIRPKKTTSVIQMSPDELFNKTDVIDVLESDIADEPQEPQEPQEPDEPDKLDKLNDLLESEQPKQLYALPQMTDPIWDQQLALGESDDDYLAFKVYLSVPSTGRTIRKSWLQYAGNMTESHREIPNSRIWMDGVIDGEKVPTWYIEMSEIFRWKERADARDSYFMNLDEHDWIEKDRKRRKKDFDVWRRLRQKALEALDKIDFETEPMCINQIVKFLELASDLQRNAIPESQLVKDEISQLMNTLPPEKKNQVIAVLMSRAKSSG